MDSLTQAALGATVAIAVMGNADGSRLKTAFAGAVLGTLPDLDVIIDYGDVVSNMVLHRTESHALLYQTLLSPVLAWLAALFCQQRTHYWRWLLASWLILVTHTAIDAMTIYGTQFGLPFTNTPFAVGSMFIIDPLYTLPLLLGLGMYISRHQRGFVFNNAMLAVSTAYLLWSVMAQWHVSNLVHRSLQQQQLQYHQVLVTPAPLNTVLWRIVVQTEQGYAEGFYSLLDDSDSIRLHHIIRDETLKQRHAALKPVQQLAWFSRGFYSLQQQGDQLLLTDLRMGQEGSYAFEFVVDPDNLTTPQQLPMRRDMATALPWLWQRIQGKSVPSPWLQTNQ
ncbi:metal-dependent hydrolase [Rheinheimera maricola]|uniref:Metal-dependent hydrolase n=1 Tax=Rheinheimera maricola TaxID=2793282 RepID=A0ABS7XBK6_9GAMM|nr:metal-dependent hydrolase [Rheinheimera maricola]MBZ9612554.1 metal-dependent hydrolase [Rheinheimera maricola]